jgi:tetratricopeptide (TPR) repeat protein
MNLRLAVVAATIISTSSLAAQTAAEHIVMGDRDHAAMNATGALRHYQAAIQADASSVEALWRASREAIDLGEFDDARRDSLYQLGEQYARRAVQSDGKSSIAHFALAKALGRRALSLSAKERVKFAAEVRKEALESLALDSTNAGALHVLARWHANIMRLNGFTRFMAKNVLGGKTFGEANWKDALALMQRASSLEPDRIVHRLELGAIYTDTGDRARARQEYETAMRLKPMDFNDKHYQEQAQKALAGLK